MAECRLAIDKNLQQWSKVKEAKNYRDFLRAYLDERSINLSDLARLTGFARGFPSDVISGRRRLTARTYPAFEKALKIPASGRKLFRLLVAIEEPDIFYDLKMSPDLLCEAVENLRKSAWIKSRRDLATREVPFIENLGQNPHIMSVFAAAGLPGQAASIEQIQKKTQLTRQEVQSSLSALQNSGLIRRIEDLYEPVELHLFLKAFDQSEAITALFQRSCLHASKRSSIAMGSNEELFFASSFCIDSGRLPELKNALRETILKFVDEAMNSDGDRVIQLITALHA
jgi:transcriptional regulator with XRE-family HTH domain